MKCPTEECATISGTESSTGSTPIITAEPPSKSVRSGKLYKCPHCSYSADKKVSLNRHMRMHATSPGGGPPASERSVSPQQPAIDRYCQDCDIRFVIFVLKFTVINYVKYICGYICIFINCLTLL